MPKYFSYIYFYALGLLLLTTEIAAQPLANHPISTESEIGFSSCTDTLKLFQRREEYDIGIILPSWRPVVSENYVAIIEGKVSYDVNTGGHGPHVSHEDLPFFHYTHDMDFDLIPDATDDNRFTNYLPYLVFKGEGGASDTALRRSIHVEWECGLGAANYTHQFRKLNNSGKSCGFSSVGHEKGDVIWNWASIGDWVHTEGHLVWDRGHPPAVIEMHPPRLLAIKRNLPEKLAFADSSFVFATRVDVFASGDGGALRNNRYGVPAFVQKVKMSSKDYSIPIGGFFPKPSPNAKLIFTSILRNGHTFEPKETVEIIRDTAHINIPWRTADGNDVDIFAKSYFFYWDEGIGIDTNYKIDEYDVRLQSLYLKKQNDLGGITENRIFANVGSNWIFLNDFLGRGDKILTRGVGHSAKKNWELSNAFKIYVPREKNFRVYTNGWDADGVDYFMGDLFNPYSPCTKKVKLALKTKLFSINHMLLAGCKDDELGEITALHSYEKLSESNYFLNYPKGGMNEDPCPYGTFPLANRYYVGYTIERK